jgi:hypothetical protein
LNSDDTNVAGLKPGPTAYTAIGAALAVLGSSGSLSSSQLSNIALNYDLMICDSSLASYQIATIKSLNPNFIVLVYCDIQFCGTTQPIWYDMNIDSHEDYFMHFNGTRIVIGANYMMDLTSNWRNAYTEWTVNKLNNIGFDGVMVDDAWNQLSKYINWGNFPAGIVSDSYIINFHNYMISFLTHLKSSVGNKLVITNTDEYESSDYISIVNGRVDETYVGKSWEPLSSIQNNAGWSDYSGHISAMNRDTANDKIVITIGGISDLSASNSQQSITWVYAASLLGTNNGKGYMIYVDGTVGGYNYTSTTSYYPILSNVYTPTSSYHQSSNAFVRDFANAQVTLNFATYTGSIIVYNNQPTPTVTSLPDTYTNRSTEQLSGYQ